MPDCIQLDTGCERCCLVGMHVINSMGPMVCGSRREARELLPRNARLYGFEIGDLLGVERLADRPTTAVGHVWAGFVEGPFAASYRGCG